MKQCPNCEELVGDDVKECFNCHYNFIYKRVMNPNEVMDMRNANERLQQEREEKQREKELKISYPTVRSRLDDIIQKLDGNPNVRSNVQSASSSRKKEILNALENGEITPEEALEQMKEN